MRSSLRRAWARFGLPRVVQVDNGTPWGSWSDLPPPLALWLIGLGVEVVWIPPCRPQRNGVVERSHGVTQGWVEAGQCGSVAELQERIDREDFVQRERYPHQGGLSRWQVYPGLRHSGRPYQHGQEETLFSWQRACEHLGEYAVDRRVDSSGKLGLYHDKLYVGTALRGRAVIVQFDAKATEWVVADTNGAELCRRRLTQFGPEGLCGLSAS